MQFNGVSCNFYFTENVDIYFQTVTDKVFLTWCLWLYSDLKGTFHRSNQVEPINKNRIARDALYTPAEKKKIKPTAECSKMYAMSKKDCYSVLDVLADRSLQQILQGVDVTAMSLYDSMLYQVSHDHKYKSYELHRQIAYYMVRWPDICWPIVKDRMSPNDTYESFIKNIFYGFTYPLTYVVIAVVSFHRSNQVEPINKNRIARDALYTPAEKKKIKPTAECSKMYAMSKKDCYSVLDVLADRSLQQILQGVDVTAMSLYDSMLYQVSHDHKYKSYELHRQIAYYMVRWPDICWPIVKDRMSPNDTYESVHKEHFLWIYISSDLCSHCSRLKDVECVY